MFDIEVIIEEVLTKTVTIKVDSNDYEDAKANAIDIVTKMYFEENIILDANDYVNTTFTVDQSEK